MGRGGWGGAGGEGGAASGGDGEMRGVEGRVAWAGRKAPPAAVAARCGEGRAGWRGRGGWGRRRRWRRDAGSEGGGHAVGDGEPLAAAVGRAGGEEEGSGRRRGSRKKEKKERTVFLCKGWQWWVISPQLHV